MTTSLGQTVLFNDLTPARVVSLANVTGTYYNGPNNNGVGATLTVAASSLTVDGVLLVKADRVLLAGQSSSYQNGIYIVSFIGTVVVLQRAFDQQNIEQLKAGQFVAIGAGSTGAGSIYGLVEPLPQVIGVSAFNYVAASSGGSLGTAAAKAASNNSLSTVASTAGAGFTMGNFTASSDALGSLVDSGFNSTNLLLYASVAISSAQFLGMSATPVLLVAAAGPNTLIVVDRLELVLNYGSAAYAAGGLVAAQYDSTATGAGVLATNTEAATDYQVTSSTTFLFNGAINIAPFSTSVNKGLYLSNQTSAFTTGNSNFIAKVHYRVITVS